MADTFFTFERVSVTGKTTYLSDDEDITFDTREEAEEALQYFGGGDWLEDERYGRIRYRVTERPYRPYWDDMGFGMPD